MEAGGKIAEALQALRMFLGTNDMMAYLAMMAPRLVELRRVLVPTGSIYLHCDPTASHYLKVMMDAVFRPENFRNEIVWERTTGRKGESQFGRVHDVLLFYSRSKPATWNPPTIAQDETTVKGHDLIRDANGELCRLSDLSGAGQGPPRKFGDKEIQPPSGRHWQFDQDGIDRLTAEGRIFFSKGGSPRLKTRVADLPGTAVRDVWTDIQPINSAAAERLGYPTQKPEALLERIVTASSNEGDTVLDPFCGCGTAIAVAQRLNRRWIGIDITHLAITLIKHRLHAAFGEPISKTYKVIGEPADIAGADSLAEEDPYQFQWWALGLVGARPVDQKKGADKGIDGRLYFHDEGPGGKTKQAIFSVKAGKTGPTHVRDLRGVVEREQAAIGVLISMQEPTNPMRTEAASAGFYESKWTRRKHPRIQLLTIAELLDGKSVDMPPVQHTSETFKKAPKARRHVPHQQPEMLEDVDPF